MNTLDQEEQNEVNIELQEFNKAQMQLEDLKGQQKKNREELDYINKKENLIQIMIKKAEGGKECGIIKINKAVCEKVAEKTLFCGYHNRITLSADWKTIEQKVGTLGKIPREWDLNALKSFEKGVSHENDSWIEEINHRKRPQGNKDQIWWSKTQSQQSEGSQREPASRNFD